MQEQEPGIENPEAWNNPSENEKMLEQIRKQQRQGNPEQGKDAK